MTSKRPKPDEEPLGITARDAPDERAAVADPQPTQRVRRRTANLRRIIAEDPELLLRLASR